MTLLLPLLPDDLLLLIAAALGNHTMAFVWLARLRCTCARFAVLSFAMPSSVNLAMAVNVKGASMIHVYDIESARVAALCTSFLTYRWTHKLPPSARYHAAEDRIVWFVGRCRVTCSASSFAKYADCKFEHWFNYRQGSEKLRQIRYARSINSNHSIRAHQEAKLKTL